MSERQRWEYLLISIEGGRMDLTLAQVQRLGKKGWEAFAVTNGQMWFKRTLSDKGEKETDE